MRDFAKTVWFKHGNWENVIGIFVESDFFFCINTGVFVNRYEEHYGEVKNSLEFGISFFDIQDFYYN